jgi:ADP-ribose pyrophosphatase YjhB (NUDIX family)
MQFSVGQHIFHLAQRGSQYQTEKFRLIESATAETVFQTAKQVLGKTQFFAQDFLFVFDDLEQSWQRIQNTFELVHSAGGIVKAQDKYLFIKRKNRWDLPKGKVEAGESYSQAAEREVFEETGVKATCLLPLLETWHCYDDFGPLTLKCTHWFAMQSPDASPTKPQSEEGIERACWLNLTEVRQVLNHSFHTVKIAFAAYESANI